MFDTGTKASKIGSPQYCLDLVGLWAGTEKGLSAFGLVYHDLNKNHPEWLEPHNIRVWFHMRNRVLVEYVKIIVLGKCVLATALLMRPALTKQNPAGTPP